MKLQIISIIGLMSISTSLLADTYVSGHYRDNGTWVEPYSRSSANNSLSDNYSSRGNTNPYTGSVGTVDPIRAEQRREERNDFNQPTNSWTNSGE